MKLINRIKIKQNLKDVVLSVKALKNSRAIQYNQRKSSLCDEFLKKLTKINGFQEFYGNTFDGRFRLAITAAGFKVIVEHLEKREISFLSKFESEMIEFLFNKNIDGFIFGYQSILNQGGEDGALAKKLYEACVAQALEIAKNDKASRKDVEGKYILNQLRENIASQTKSDLDSDDERTN